MGKSFQMKAPQQQARVTPQQPPQAAESEPVLIQKNNIAMARETEDILHDGQTSEDKDKPNVKHADMDFSRNENFVGGKRMIQTDGLSRALNADCYLIDAAKDWGVNPLGGRPVSVRFTREFPGKKILYDHFDASPEMDTKEKADKLVNFKMGMVNAHGYIYLFQHPWVTLTAEQLDKQLAEQREKLKNMETAQQKKIGLWQDTNAIAPWDYRKMKRELRNTKKIEAAKSATKTKEAA